MSIGNCEFGARKENDGTFRPYISFKGSNTYVEFLCSHTFHSLESAGDFSHAIFQLLIGEKENLKMHEYK